VHRCYCFYRFQFKYDAPSYEDVDSIPTLKFNAFIYYWNGNLPAELKLPDTQFMSETLLIGGFEETWPKKSVDFKRGANYFVGERVMLHSR